MSTNEKLPPKANTKKKRIAIFTPQLNDVGTSLAMWNYAIALESPEYDVDLVRAGEEWRGMEVPNANVRIVALPTAAISTLLPDKGFLYRLSSALVALVSIFSLAFYLWRTRPEVFIVGLHPLAARLALSLSRHKGKFVISVQGLPRASRFRSKQWRYLAKRADCVIVPVKSIGGVVRSISGVSELPFEVVPNAVLENEYLLAEFPAPDHPWFREKSTPIVLGAGRLSYQKNFELLIKSFAHLHKDSDARLVIVGEGELRADLEQLVSDLELGDVVDLRGHVDNPLSYMAHSDVFVLSSRWEGPGHVLIEALSTGTPCVTVDCPHGPSDILGDGRYGTVTSTDPSELASSILELLENPVAARIKSKEGAENSGSFTPRSVSEQLSLVIGKLLKSA